MRLQHEKSAVTNIISDGNIFTNTNGSSQNLCIISVVKMHVAYKNRYSSQV